MLRNLLLRDMTNISLRNSYLAIRTYELMKEDMQRAHNFALLKWSLREAALMAFWGAVFFGSLAALATGFISYSLKWELLLGAACGLIGASIFGTLSWINSRKTLIAAPMSLEGPAQRNARQFGPLRFRDFARTEEYILKKYLGK